MHTAARRGIPGASAIERESVSVRAFGASVIVTAGNSDDLSHQLSRAIDGNAPNNRRLSRTITELSSLSRTRSLYKDSQVIVATVAEGQRSMEEHARAT